MAQDGELQHAIDKALAYLSYRSRSEREIVQRLVRYGFGSELIDKVVGRLRELGLVDDLSFSRQWISDRDHLNPKAGRVLKTELARKGVPREFVDQAIAEGEDDYARARALALRKAARLKGHDSKAVQQRIGGILLRRGFPYEIVARITREITHQDGASRDE